VCYYSLAGFVLSYVVCDFFDCAADFVSENASGAELAFYFFQVCSAYAAGFHPDQNITCL